MTDARFQFGSLSVSQPQGAPLQFGFQYPGSVEGYFAGHGNSPVFIRRYHPIQAGFSQSYRVDFRLGTQPELPVLQPRRLALVMEYTPASHP